MRLKLGKVSIRRGELNSRNLCSNWNVISTMANKQPNVNNFTDRIESKGILPTSIDVIDVLFLRFLI